MGEGMSREVKVLRAMAWVVLVAGLVGAVLLWITAREVVEETRRIVGHATLTFQDLEVRISVLKIALGAAILVLGLFLWALGRVVAGLAEARSDEPSGRPVAARRSEAG
jgi:hypothetical protein